MHRMECIDEMLLCLEKEKQLSTSANVTLGNIDIVLLSKENLKILKKLIGTLIN